MFQQFQEKLSDEQLALQLITQKGFSDSLLQTDLKQFIKFIQNDKKTSHLSSSIIIAIFSLILLAPHKISYNQKAAIEILTKLYRDSSLSLQYKQIISGLLVRIPNFNNYRMIVKTMVPKYIKEAQLTKQICQTIKKQASKQFEFVWQKYKNQWFCSNESPQDPKIFNSVQLHYSRNLVEQLKSFKTKIQQLLSFCQKDTVQSSDFLRVTTLNSQITNQFEYLRKRSQNIANQQLDIQSILQIFTFIRDINLKNINSSLPIIFSTILTNFVVKVKQMNLKILNSFLCRVRRKLLKCIKWMSNFIEQGLIQAAKNSYCHLGCYLTLLSNYIQVFGLGALDWKNIFFEEQYSLQKLLQSLCNTNYLKQEKQEINFQKNKNKNKQDKKIEYKLNIQSHLRKGHYEHYLNFANNSLINTFSLQQKQRERLLAICLDIFYTFYSNSNHYKASTIIHILQNSKNRLKEPSITLMNNISRIIYRPNVQFKPGFQYFCEDILSKKVKLAQSKLQQKQQQMILQQELNKNQNQVFPYKTKTNKSSSPKPIVKTVSYQLQGWQNQFISNNTNYRDQNMMKSFENKSDPSQMFYSLKQASIKQDNENKLIEQKKKSDQLPEKISKAQSFESFTQIKNKNPQDQQQDGFVLTPQF